MDKFFMRPDKSLSPQARHRPMDVKFSHACAICSFASTHYFAADIVEDNRHIYILISDVKNKIKQVRLPVVRLKVDQPEKLLLLGKNALAVEELYDYFDMKSKKTVSLTNDRLDDLRMVTPCKQCGALSMLIISTAVATDDKGRILAWTDKDFNDPVDLPIALLWNHWKDKYTVVGLFKRRTHSSNDDSTTDVPSEDLFFNSQLTEQKRVINLISEGLFLAGEQKPKEAISCLDNAIKIEPNYAVAWQNKGQALDKIGNNDAAIECFAKAITLDSSLIMSWNDMGATLSRIGRYQEAFQIWKRLLKLAPNWRRPWLNKGVNYGRLGESYKALECYDKAVAIDPNYAAAWHHKGTTYAVLELYESYDKALECFNKAITLEPNNATFHYDKGYFACGHYGHWKEAVESYDKAININLNYADAWNRKGHALVMLGKDNWDEAMNCYKKNN